MTPHPTTPLGTVVPPPTPLQRIEQRIESLENQIGEARGAVELLKARVDELRFLAGVIRGDAG